MKTTAFAEVLQIFDLYLSVGQDNGSGFLVGASVTWVDLLIAEVTQGINANVNGFLDAFPEVSIALILGAID